MSGGHLSFCNVLGVPCLEGLSTVLVGLGLALFFGRPLDALLSEADHLLFATLTGFDYVRLLGVAGSALRFVAGHL